VIANDADSVRVPDDNASNAQRKGHPEEAAWSAKRS
jgi:hypothetical protein